MKKAASITCVFYLLISAFFLNIRTSTAESWQNRNPADRLHPWVSNINPGIISMQDASVSFGHKVFHLGFLPDNSLGIQSSRINASLPFYLPLGLAIGVDLRLFSAGIYSEFAGAFMMSKEIFPQFSIGAKIGMDRYAFNKENFNIVDENDPLLSGSLARNSLNLGFGIYWNPGALTFGIGADHLNRPNVGFQTMETLMPEISGAAGFRLGPLMPSIIVQSDHYGLRYGFSLTVAQDRMGTMRFSYDTSMPIKVELSLNLSRSSRLQYGYDFSGEGTRGVSSGSHELIYTRILGRPPDIGMPVIRLSTRKVKIIKEKIVRRMPATLRLAQVQSMDDLAAEYLKPWGSKGNLVIIPTGGLVALESASIRKQRYAQLAKEVKQMLRQEPDLKVILRVTNNSMTDAQALKRYLVNNKIARAASIRVAKLKSTGTADVSGFRPGRRVVSNKRAVFTAKKVDIKFKVPGKTRRVKDWQMVITDTKGNVIKKYHGTKNLVKQIGWNLRNEIGELVAPGQYSCSLTLHTGSGKKRVVTSQPLQIVRINRTVELRFANKARGLKSGTGVTPIASR